ncbi:Membrane-bound lytic murein transglycosylase B precursor [Ruegeria denitrificans]|uniref:Membrane-bound lytic murein transglycosylase B n=1 Tax=Ruegeria denitrificans TaxID=1715692 RepID=A0A0P1IKB5_9RHOB|nr:lytic murein transglycosylase [Ruegeria denitrificans]CUK19431.1 Membrane-bound lytic murein transglycosylase B precursor [Ruegeria denitrificans]
MRKCVSGIIAAALWASIVQAESLNSADGSQTFQLASADITVSLRPVVRPSFKEYRVSTEGNARFQAWLGAFRERAVGQGVSSATLDRALAGLTYDKKIIERDRNQAEFSKPIWEYLDAAVSDRRISNGRVGLDRHKATLTRIEAQYGVEKEVVTAIWGLETSFGTFRGSDQTIRSLATLAFDARRAQFFETQLIAALRIVQAGDVSAENMVGSWAGAMGHTQFMPTSYLDHAVDFDGDGRRDIWSDDPTDALASAAAYLARHGWTKGQPWGVEVRLPDGFDYARAKRDYTLLPSDWAAHGVVGRDGKPVPDHGQAAILLPAGGQGVALMIFDNFGVIEKYNGADAYVIGIGHLSDRLAGHASFQRDWPRGDRVLSFTEKKELQTRLTAAGFDTQGIDGRTGPNTTDAVRAYQLAQGLLPDGYASLNLLERLR